MKIQKIPLGPVMTDLRGLQLEVDEHDMLMHPHVGGVILFTRNYESLEQITTLCKSIHDLREPHLLIAVDHEGGRVQRFRDGFSRLPSCASLAKCQTTHDAESLCQKAGWLMAAELLAIGVDISFDDIRLKHDAVIIATGVYKSRPNIEACTCLYGWHETSRNVGCRQTFSWAWISL